MNDPFAVTLRLSPPLSCSTTVPDSPDTVPPTVYVAALAQETATLVTLAEPTVPDPLETVQDCPDGFVFTVTLYAAPLASGVANVNDPFARHAQVIPAVILQHHRPGQPRHRPADRVGTPRSAAGPVVGGAVPVGHDARRAAGEDAVGDRHAA